MDLTHAAAEQGCGKGSDVPAEAARICCWWMIGSYFINTVAAALID